VMTRADGTVKESAMYMPYGGKRGGAEIAESDYLFTDQEKDKETGLYNYDARNYDPISGGFVSPDNIVPDWYVAQSLNRYAYCVNNPLKYTDPDGHIHIGVAFGAFSGAIAGAIAGMNDATSFGAAVMGGIAGGVVGGLVGAAVGMVAPQASSAVAVGAVSGLLGGVCRRCHCKRHHCYC
jgi:RHS repeat-associated protein